MGYFIVIIYSQSHFIKITEILSFLDKNILSKCIKYCFNMDWISKIFRGGGVRRRQPRSDFSLDPRLVIGEKHEVYFRLTSVLSKFTVLPLARIFPCHKEILALARKMQGNKFHKEIARKNSHLKGSCKDC